jgi:hypothetical protein
MKYSVSNVSPRKDRTLLRISIALSPIIALSLVVGLCSVSGSVVSTKSDAEPSLQSAEFPTMPVVPRQRGVQPDVSDAEFITLPLNLGAMWIRAHFSGDLEQRERAGYPKGIERPPEIRI